MFEKEELSRRVFLGGVSALATSVAAVGLTGCGTTAAEKTAEASDETDAAEGATVNDGEAASEAERWMTPAGRAWRTAPEPVEESKITDGGTYDLVIVGGGMAGTWAARSAAENGLSALVIESQTEEDHMFVGGEVGTINCQWALDHGAQKIDPQDFMREVYRRNEGRNNQRFIKDYVENSGKLLDKVIDELGESWMDEHTHIGSCPPDDRMVMDPSGFKFYTGTTIFRDKDMPLSAWSWSEVMNLQVKAAQEGGSKWAYNTHAEYLEKNEAGRVTAVVAKNIEDDSYIRYVGEEAVILAGGDFAGNVDMLRDINDEYRHLAESMGDIEIAACIPMFLDRDGSSIAMGVWAGGHVEVGPRSAMNTGQAGPEAPWGPGSLVLNQEGKRFCDECAGGAEGFAYMVPRQPKGSVCIINDKNWEEIVYTMPPCHEAVDYRREISWPLTVDAMKAVEVGDEPTDVPAYSTTAKVYCAQTIEKLVEIVGIWDEDQQAAAVEEIKKYQGYAENGVDEDFAKDERILAATKCNEAPFYAVVGSTDALNPGLCQTTGLDVDSEHRVVDNNLNPIPGLFALGNSSGNRFAVQYSTPLSGMSLGFCLVEGSLLPERIASGEIA